MTHLSHAAPTDTRRASARTDGRASVWSHRLFPLVGAGLTLTYAALLAWPMRIWYRPVSPDTHLVGTLGIDLRGMLIYVGTVLLLFTLYGIALWLVLTRRARPSPALVLGVSMACSALLVLTHPLTSTDVFNYIASARVLWVHGENPLTVAPAWYPDDPFYGFLRSWQVVPSPYGPLWSLIAGLPLAVGGGSVLGTVIAFKALAAAAFLGAGWLVYLTARLMRPDSAVAALLAYSWNPLAVFYIAGNGHNDAVMILLLALALYALARRWPALAIVAVVASALVKYATVLAVPLVLLWWWRSKRRPSRWSLVVGAIAALVLIVVTYAPLWAGRDTFATTLNEGSYYTVSVPAAVRGLLAQRVGVARADQITTLVSRLAMAAALGVILLRLRGGRLARLAEAGFLAYFAYLVLAATYFAPWYVLWALTFACLVPFRRDVLWPAITLSLTAMAVLVAAVWFRERFAPDPRADWLGMHIFAAVVVFPLPLLVWLWAVRFPAGTPVRRAALRRSLTWRVRPTRAPTERPQRRI